MLNNTSSTCCWEVLEMICGTSNFPALFMENKHTSANDLMGFAL
jgi:hypothetical protein